MKNPFELPYNKDGSPAKDLQRYKRRHFLQRNPADKRGTYTLIIWNALTPETMWVLTYERYIRIKEVKRKANPTLFRMYVLGQVVWVEDTKRAGRLEHPNQWVKAHKRRRKARFMAIENRRMKHWPA